VKEIPKWTTCAMEDQKKIATSHSEKLI